MLRSLRLRSGVRSFDRVVVELEDSGRAPRINAIRLLDGSGGGAVAPVPGAELPGDSRDAVWATGVVKPFRQDSSYSFVALDGDAGDAFLVRSLRQELAQGDEVRVRLEDAGKGAPRIVEVKRVGWRDPRIAKKRRLEEGALPSKERGNARPAWTLTRPQRACVEALLRAIGLQSGQLVMTLCCGRLRWAWVKGMRCELLAPSFDLGANEIMAFSMALDAGECSEECGFVIDMDCCTVALCAVPEGPLCFSFARGTDARYEVHLSPMRIDAALLPFRAAARWGRMVADFVAVTSVAGAHLLLHRCLSPIVDLNRAAA